MAEGSQKPLKLNVYEKLTNEIPGDVSPKSQGSPKSLNSPKGFKAKLQRMMSASKFSSMPNSPSSPCTEKFFPSSNSCESLLRNEERDRPTSLDESRLSISKLKAKELERSRTMTSPAINGQKDNGKNGSTSSNEEVANTSVSSPAQESASPLMAWWRVFKFAKLLMQQGC